MQVADGLAEGRNVLLLQPGQGRELLQKERGESEQGSTENRVPPREAGMLVAVAFDDAGMADCFRDDSTCLVEWPERVASRLPRADVAIVVCDAALRHQIDDKPGYEQMVDTGRFRPAPAGTDAAAASRLRGLAKTLGAVKNTAKVQEGDSVAKGEPLYELDTDKVTQEVEAEVDGVLQKIVVAEGEAGEGRAEEAKGDEEVGALRPVLLLDDVSSELDATRNERLFDFLRNNGIVFTEERIKLAFACLFTAVGISSRFSDASAARTRSGTME